MRNVCMRGSTVSEAVSVYVSSWLFVVCFENTLRGVFFFSCEIFTNKGAVKTLLFGSGGPARHTTQSRNTSRKRVRDSDIRGVAASAKCANDSPRRLADRMRKVYRGAIPDAS